jgi:thioredoxin 1
MSRGGTTVARVQKVNAGDFSREVLFSPVPVMVDLYADWCGPCRALAPPLERLAEHYAGRVKFVKVSIDEDPEVAEVYRVEGVPTLLYFKAGSPADRVVGLTDPRSLVAKLDRLAAGVTA